MNVDTFIIRVGFELTNVDIIRTQSWTRIATPTESCFRSQPLLTPCFFLPFSLIEIPVKNRKTYFVLILSQFLLYTKFRRKTSGSCMNRDFFNVDSKWNITWTTTNSTPMKPIMRFFPTNPTAMIDQKLQIINLFLISRIFFQKFLF